MILHAWGGTWIQNVHNKYFTVKPPLIFYTVRNFGLRPNRYQLQSTDKSAPVKAGQILGGLNWRLIQ